MAKIRGSGGLALIKQETDETVPVECPCEEYQMKKDGAGGPVLYAYAYKYEIAASLMGDSNLNRDRNHP